MKVAKRKILLKTLEKFTAKDLYNFWCDEYYGVHGEVYSASGFIGHDLSLLKGLLEVHDIYEILNAIRLAVVEKGIVISSLSNNFDFYSPNTNYHNLLFYVGEKGGEYEKGLLVQISVIENKWFPAAQDIVKMNKMVQELNEWIEIVK